MSKLRLIRILVIGTMHSMLYFYLRPKVILPATPEDYHFLASITATAISIILTIFIVRLTKKQG